MQSKVQTVKTIFHPESTADLSPSVKKYWTAVWKPSRRIITVYVNRIDVYPDEVVIQFNYMPDVRVPLLKRGSSSGTKKESPDALEAIKPSFMANHPKYMGDFGGESTLLESPIYISSIIHVVPRKPPKDFQRMTLSALKEAYTL